MGLLGELGATWSRWGQPLPPIGVMYDLFVKRAVEPCSFGMYAGGQSILVGTPRASSWPPRAGPPVHHQPLQSGSSSRAGHLGAGVCDRHRVVPARGRAGFAVESLLLLFAGPLTLLPLWLFSFGVRTLQLGVSSTLQFINPAVQLLIGTVVLHEPMTLARWVAVLLVVGGPGLRDGGPVDVSTSHECLFREECGPRLIRLGDAHRARPFWDQDLR